MGRTLIEGLSINQSITYLGRFEDIRAFLVAMIDMIGFRYKIHNHKLNYIPSKVCELTNAVYIYQ